MPDRIGSPEYDAASIIAVGVGARTESVAGPALQRPGCGVRGDGGGFTGGEMHGVESDQRPPGGMAWDVVCVA